MRQGRIEQIAAPDTVFDHPATAYIADLVGASKFWDATARDGRVTLPDGSSTATDLSGPVRVMSRPHNIRLTPGTAGPWTGTVLMHRPLGALTEYVVGLSDGQEIKVSALRQEQAQVLPDAADVTLTLRNPAQCAVYPVT